jgi:uncharacterized protein (TIGR04255 family)
MSQLPEFENPPIAELVLGLQFSRIAGLTCAHIGRLTSRFSKDYPKLQDLPALPPSFEVFGIPAGPIPSFQIQPVTDFTPRVWMISEDEVCLIQFQADRLVCNWRKVRPSDTYPRYGAMKSKFFGALEIVTKFLQQEGLHPIQPNQCEVTYLNHVPLTETNDWWSEPARLVKILREPPYSGERERLEDARVQLRYIIQSEDNRPLARLVVNAEPGITAGFERIMAINLSAKGQPRPSIEGVEQFFDMAHESIVRKFEQITTSAAHKLWGKQIHAHNGIQ